MELDDLLECSVCLESLGPEHRVLPCQHTFCTKCLSDVAAKYARLKSSSSSTLLLCPECRAPCQIALHLLPTNIILNRILAAKQAPKNSPNFALSSPVTNSNSNSNLQMSISALASPTKDVFGLATSFNALNPFLNPQLSSASSTDVFAPSSGSASTTPTNSFMTESTISATSNETLSVATGASVASSPPPMLPPKSSSAFPLPPLLPARPQSAPVLDVLTQGKRDFCRYRALYDYKPVQKDELRLVKNDLLIVTEKCADGWFKGYKINEMESGGKHTCIVGVFPGNYVREVIESDNNGGPNSTTQSGARMQVGMGQVDDDEELDMFGCTKTFGIQPQTRGSSSSRPSDPAASSTSRTISHSSSVQSNLNGRHQGEKYRCVVAFPASSEYELDLRQGDIVFLTSRRDDGWCQGWQERTNKNGLFPASFVVKM